MSTDRSSHALASNNMEAAPTPRPAFPGFLRRLAALFERAGRRSMLAELTNDQLRDIGLSRGEALRRANKPFWKP